MIPPKYNITCQGRKIPWSDNYDGMIWGTWEGSDRHEVWLLLAEDPRIDEGTTMFLDPSGALPPDGCEKGMFWAHEEKEFYDRRDQHHPPQQAK